MQEIYYAIVGAGTDTNQGLARFLGVVVLFIAVAGTLFWLVGA